MTPPATVPALPAYWLRHTIRPTTTKEPPQTYELGVYANLDVCQTALASVIERAHQMGAGRGVTLLDDGYQESSTYGRTYRWQCQEVTP